VTGDCYAILGVHPAAEDVVIGAAYRALMRHYHPDTNPDPRAQARVREITAAYALLRDPARRAEYDARRAQGDDLWLRREPPPPPPPPAMRAAGIASALLALGLVGAVWAWPRPDPPAPRVVSARPEGPRLAGTRPGPAPAVELQPEPERLAALRDRIAPSEPVLPVMADVSAPVAEAADPPSELRMASVAPRPAAPRPKPSRRSKPAAPPVKSERVATLDRLSTGFFDQSMTHATAAKKEQLLSMRGRFAAERGACRSEDCVAGSYARQMRETSAIMEGRAEPAK